MEYTTLSNDVQVPLLGLGTFMIGPEDTEKSVYAALKMGYRLIDTANAYVNEEAVGRGLRRALEEGLVKREDIFISTKLWPTLYEKAGAVDKTLERLGVDYVDLLFIHQPAGNYLAGYAAIEQAYRDGKARSLGISNFHGDKLENSWPMPMSSPMSSSWKRTRTTSTMISWPAWLNTVRSSWAGIHWGMATRNCSATQSLRHWPTSITRVRHRLSCAGLSSGSSSPSPARRIRTICAAISTSSILP